MTNNEFNIAFQPFLDYFPTADMTKEKLNIYFGAKTVGKTYGLFLCPFLGGL